MCMTDTEVVDRMSGWNAAVSHIIWRPELYRMLIIKGKATRNMCEV